MNRYLPTPTTKTINNVAVHRYKPYPAYKNSRVEWLGEVPEGWKVRKLKHIASVKFSSVDKKTEEGEYPVCLCNYVDVYYNDYITFDLNFMKATASSAEIQNFTLKEGDILITKDSESWDDIAVPAHVSSDFNDVLCGYHLAQIRPNISLSDGEYLFRSFYARGINDQFRVAATGVTRYGLGKYWLDNSLFLVPPLSEQRAIAAFLDRETGRIDTLIEKKVRQVELLQEKRAALISHAVTKGLDPDVPMKDSGVEWLGDVPEGWRFTRMKYTLREKLKYGANESAELDDTNLPRYIRITDFGDDGKLKDDTFKSLPFEVAKDYILQHGDVLFARSGATVGKTFQFKKYDGLACFAGYLIKATPNENIILSDYLYFLTKSNLYENWKNNTFSQATIQNIGADKYSVLPIILPMGVSTKNL